MSAMQQMLMALAIIFAAPYLVWRIGRTDHWAPLVVVQILMGLVLGPGLLGAAFPHYYTGIFSTEVIWMLSGIASWGVILFVWLAGLEMDLREAWRQRKDGLVSAGAALFFPLILGAGAANVILLLNGSWQGEQASTWQFALGIGMACSVTALPILVLFMRKLGVLRQGLGQRVLRYASLDDIAVWAILAFVVMEVDSLWKQAGFIVFLVVAAQWVRRLFPKLPMADRWFAGIIWLVISALLADWAGLHYMVGAFLAGAVMDRDWFDERLLDQLREIVLLVLMPVFFLSTGLKTEWVLSNASVLIVALALLLVSVFGKWMGAQVAGHLLGWQKGEAQVIAWLLQTKALIMIIFANVLLDKLIISPQMFTALLVMAAMSTMLTMPLASRALRGLDR